MPSINEIFDLLKTLDLSCKFGIAGSYSRGTARIKSDIDIVVDSSIDIPEIELIKKSIKEKFGKKSDVLCLNLLYEEDCRLDRLAESVGLEPNDESIYKTVLKDVIWCE